jgi:glycosyltransferase involved in cell wall biosynthesis
MTATTGSPMVSVVVPTYYRNDLLADTLESVRGQSYDPVETVVVDDSGEGHAAPVVDSFEDVRYIELDANRGANRARTVGAEAARGEFVHFLDDDDLMYEPKVERQVEVMERTEGVGVVYTGLEKKGDRVDRPSPEVRGEVLETALAFEMWPCMTSTMLLRWDVLETILPLPDRAAANDLEVMIQLARETAFEFVDAPLLYKRIDTDGLGSSSAAVACRKEIIAEYDHLYDAHPDRVRASALAHTYETEGALLLRKEGWSVAAIRALLRHLYHTPDGKLRSSSKVLAACFGKPGWKAANWVNRRLPSTGR